MVARSFKAKTSWLEIMQFLHPATYDRSYLLYQPTDSGLAQIGPVSRVTGRMDGMNESGLTMGYNFMHGRNQQMVLYVI